MIKWKELIIIIKRMKLDSIEAYIIDITKMIKMKP